MVPATPPAVPPRLRQGAHVVVYRRIADLPGRPALWYRTVRRITNKNKRFATLSVFDASQLFEGTSVPEAPQIRESTSGEIRGYGKDFGPADWRFCLPDPSDPLQDLDPQFAAGLTLWEGVGKPRVETFLQTVMAGVHTMKDPGLTLAHEFRLLGFLQDRLQARRKEIEKHYEDERVKTLVKQPIDY